MFGRPQSQTSSLNSRQNKIEEMNEPMFEIEATVQKPKTRRGGVKVRARAARAAQRLAFQEEQRKQNARNRANAEAAENAIRLRIMHHSLQGQQRVEEKTGGNDSNNDIIDDTKGTTKGKEPCPTCRKTGHEEQDCWFARPELNPFKNGSMQHNRPVSAIDDKGRHSDGSNQATTEAAERIISFGRMQNALQEDNYETPVEPDVDRVASLGEECKNTAKAEDDVDGDLDIELADGGCGRCICTLVCVCDATRCICADMCYCDSSGNARAERGRS
jgi:hypothetical protein